MNLALSVANTMGADADTSAGAAGVGGVRLCMGDYWSNDIDALNARKQEQ